MNHKRVRFFLGIVVLLVGNCSLLWAQVDPWEMVKRMGRGINLGNTLDAPYEGQWADPAQEYYFDDFVDAGFTCVRIPVRWDNHLGTEPPFTIDSTWLDRVEQVVDWALDRNMVTIINSHHDDWLYSNFPDQLPRFESLWRQIAERFKDKPDNLLFEIINEPYFDLNEQQVDSLNSVILQIIRETNPTRIVILTGGSENSYKAILHLHPPDDQYLMGYFHYYLPWSFTNDKKGTWGNAQDKATMDAHFDVVKDWSDQHNIPILLGEFGVSVGADRPSLLAWYDYAANGAIRRGFAFTVWDAGPKANKYTYYRLPGAWDEAQLNVLTNQRPFNNSPWIVPGVIQAEDFDKGELRIAYNDSDTLNSKGYYRLQAGVEIDTIFGEGYAVIFDQPGEWTEYTFQVDSSGFYKITLRASAENDQASLYLRFNGSSILGPFSGFSVGGLSQFTELNDSLYLTKGVHVFRLGSESGGVGVDWLEFSFQNSGGDNLLQNPGFEMGMQDWQIKQTTVTVVDTPVHSGQKALLINNRVKPWSGIYQNIKQTLLDHGPGYYIVSGYFQAVSDTGVIGKVKVRLTYGGSQHHIGALGKMDTTTWTLISDTLLLNWDSPLEDANFFVQTANGYLQDFWVDDVSLVFVAGVTAVENDVANNLPESIELTNHPNPFNSGTIIRFQLPFAEQVDLSVFDLQGRLVRRLIEAPLPAGSHTIIWKGKNEFGQFVSSGCYFAVLKTPNFVKVRKMFLLR